MTDWAKFIQAKTALAAKGVAPSGPPAAGRVPPGQKQVNDFPVLDLGIRPDIDARDWTLRVFGLAESELCLDWPEFQALPQAGMTSDFHCVTRWSRLDMDWQGVPARELVALAGPLPEARFVTLHGYDDYTANLPLSALLDDDVLLAHSVFGQPLSAEHGGPVRLVVPKRYGWKSAKWLKAIEFHQTDRPGFWEVRGYHNDADPWAEQRFGHLGKGEP